ncbi:MAG: hypothetical protein ACE5Z5_08060 [Candidatus Bathyarchaeia archaeon]
MIATLKMIWALMKSPMVGLLKRATYVQFFDDEGDLIIGIGLRGEGNPTSPARQTILMLKNLADPSRSTFTIEPDGTHILTVNLNEEDKSQAKELLEVESHE